VPSLSGARGPNGTRFAKSVVGFEKVNARTCERNGAVFPLTCDAAPLGQESMFTGIIEATGRIREIRSLNGASTFIVEAPFVSELIVGQSVAHNGVCLTVESIDVTENVYRVTLIRETLEKSALGAVASGEIVNLERCLAVGARIDGHIVQGHVDCVGLIASAVDEPGQKRFTVHFPTEFEELVVYKGSICIDGISLTVAENDPGKHSLDVCIIPHTLQVTNAQLWTAARKVNLEFDVLGKYAKKWMDVRRASVFPEQE